MDRNEKSIYESDRCQPRRSSYASFTRTGNTLYMHIHFWPASTAVIAGLIAPVKSARLLATGQEVKFEQDRLRVRFLNLPANAPDNPVTTIAVECESEPKQDNEFVRRERDRLRV